MTVRWPIVPLGTCIKHVRRPTTVADTKVYRRVTVRLRGQGMNLRDEVPGSAIKTKKQYIISENDLLVAEIDAKAGAYGIVPGDLSGSIVSGHYFTYQVDGSVISPKFLDYWLKTPAAHTQVLEFIRGSLNYAAIRPNHFPQIRIPMPSLDVQAHIVGKIDEISSRSAEASRLRESIASERDEMLRAFARELAKDSPRRPMQEVAPIVRRPIELDKTAEYPELGIRSFGKGTFHKPAVAGATLGSKRLYRIEPGDLLFSNVFSWEGAIAVVRDADAGRFGSHRFITCVPNPTLATAEFLRCWLLTAEGMAYILEASPGAAGRNRTLGLKKLMAIRVPVPPLAAQKKLSELSGKVAAARQVQDTVADEMRNLMPALLDRAFKGAL